MNSCICTSDLTKTYGVGQGKVVAISQINLTVQPGEFVTIMGPSGSGKTTLLSCLGCITEPTEGQIFIDGLNIYNHRRRPALSMIRREKIGFVFQSFNLIPFLSAIENVEIAISITRGKRKRAMELLDHLELGNKYNRKPSELSGGEKQRVSIARALANSPKIILADEPTANLDTEHGHQVMQILKNISNTGKVVIMVTHDIRMASYANRIIQMVDGKIVGDNPTTANG